MKKTLDVDICTVEFISSNTSLLSIVKTWVDVNTEVATKAKSLLERFIILSPVLFVICLRF